MVTLKDVALEAGVSPATVSYALRGGEHVSQSTMLRIEAATKKLNYRINQTARNLKRGRTGVIEVGVHEFDEPFYSRYADAVVDRIAASDYQALVVKASTSEGTMREAVSYLADQPCDGLITHVVYLKASELKRLSLGKPVVLIDDFSKKLAFDTVIVNGCEGIRMATRHLIERGCRNIAMVGGAYAPIDKLSLVDSKSLRVRGFASAMMEAGLPYTPAQMYDAAWTTYPGREAALRIIRDGMPFDGIVCATDQLAVGLIRGFADKGINLPVAVKITGFDGISLGQYTVPSLTTVSVNITDFADKAVSMLIERIEKTYDGEPRCVEAKLDLVVRESSQ